MQRSIDGRFIPPKRFKTHQLTEEDEFLSEDELKQEIKLEISRRIHSEDIKIPMISHVASKVMQASNDPNISAAQIASIIKQDQQIAGKVIQIANSPVYAGLTKVTSIQRAITQIGMRALRDLIYGIAMGSTIFRSKEFKELMNEMWTHSLSVGYIAQQVAEQIWIDSEYAFLCGLMHDVGKPLILDVITGIKRKSPEKLFLTDDSLNEIIDEFHQDVGGLVARAWDFPEQLHEAITMHHRYSESKDPQMAQLVYFADVLYYYMGIGNLEKEVDPYQDRTVRDLALDAQKMEILIAKLETEVPSFLIGFMG